MNHNAQVCQVGIYLDSEIQACRKFCLQFVGPALSLPLLQELTARKLHRLSKDIVRYNKITTEVMIELTILLHDLFQPILEAGLETCLMRDGVHLTHTGSTLLGRIVADRILES